MNRQQLDASILAMAFEADARGEAFAWLDGGDQARGFFGVQADAQVESDSLESIERVDAMWRAQPDRVWMGWASYDVGADAILGRRPRAQRVPGFVARRYAAAWELPARGEGEGEGEGGCDVATPRVHGDAAAATRLAKRVGASPSLGARAWPFGPLQADVEPAEYRAQVSAAIEHIRAGDTYQVNLSQALRANFVSPNCSVVAGAVEAFEALRRRTPATMGALLRVAHGCWIVSNSPETLFDLRSDTGVIASWPIKGTRARASDVAEDLGAARALQASEKDQAEHVMIVDLVRNDLGRIAVPGSVQVTGPPALVSLPTVHHLVSEVRARVPASWSLRGVMEALFPGGSITGAPKRRTLQIIEALEGAPRGIYCGAIFVLEPGGIRVSIPIRTARVDGEGLYLRSGGGVVVDSDPELERLETLAKSRAFEPEPGLSFSGELG